MTNDSLKDEYLDASSNMKHYGTLHFAELTVFVAITAGIITLVFTSHPPLLPLIRKLLKFGGFIVTICFWLMDISGVYLWTHFAKRAAELESQLGYRQYSSLPGAPKFNRIRPATVGLWLFYILILIFWVTTIIWNEKF